MNDLRFAIRQLLKNPGFTAVAVLTLALGIGANTTVFCWIQNVLLRPLPGVAQADRMIVLLARTRAAQHDGMSLPDVRDYAGLKDIFAGVIGSQFTPASVTVDGRTEWTYGQIVTANYFDVLGVMPLLGRGFLPDEDLKPGGNPVLVISEGYWRRKFGADLSVIGKTIAINQKPFTIVGVAPGAFKGTMSGLGFEFWAPVSMHREVANFGSLTARNDHWLHTQARLQPGVRIEQAQGAVDRLAQALQTTYPAENHEVTIALRTLWNAPYGGQSVFRPLLEVLAAVSICVLLIVAANVANLLLARATGREKEIAIRLAVGASRARLLRQLLTESVLLALLGGGLGALLATVGSKFILTLMPSTPLPLAYAFELDRQTLGFTILLAVGTGVFFGLAPAWQAGRANLIDSLRQAGRVSVANSRHGLRNTLVCAEIAIALMLLVCAGLCVRGFQQSQRIDPGLDPHNVLLAGTRLGAHGYTEQTAKIFYRRVQEELRATPGVTAAALASWLPLGFEGDGSSEAVPEGYQPVLNENLSVNDATVSPGYFETMHIPVLDGRDFTEQDDEKMPAALIINEAMAKRFWPGQSPVGRKIRAFAKTYTIIGVVKSGKYRSLSEPALPFMYRTYKQGVPDLNLTIVARSAGDPTGMIAAVRRVVHQLDPAVEIWATLPMESYVKAAYVSQRVAATLLLLLGGLALLLAGMGLYAVLAYVVGQRTQEIGIRMALGAQATDVLGMVLNQGMRLVGIGVAAGLAGSLALGRLLAGFLYGVSPFDPLVYLSVAAILAAVALAACLIPASRAARVDPMVALRND